MTLPPVDLAEVLAHVRGLAAAAAAAGRDDEAAWWNAQARRWSIDPTVAKTVGLRRELELLDRVDPAIVEAFARICAAGPLDVREPTSGQPTPPLQSACTPHRSPWEAMRHGRPVRVDDDGRRFYVDQWGHHIHEWSDVDEPAQDHLGRELRERLAGRIRHLRNQP